MKKIFYFLSILTSITLCGNLSGQCPGMQTFNSDGTWTAPSSGGPVEVIITCNGAGGGNAANNRVGGNGAQTIGTFTIQENEVLNIIVGQAGSNNTGVGGGGGGGGGSAVINCGTSGNCASGTLLIAASGAGGGGAGGDGGAGQASQGSGGPGVCNPAGGGGGLNGASDCDNRQGGQASFTATSQGGTGSNNGGNGGNGFGGGGSGYFGVGGGGGGHSGGEGGPGGGSGNGPGQGGESFNTGSNPTNTSGGGATATADGSVVINCITGLPVELKYFTASQQRNDALLTWETASEINNQGFEIEHSTDGRNWQNIGFVSGNGTSYNLNNYQFLHFSPVLSFNYYRLKQMDYDGAFEYSKIISIDLKNPGDGIRISPNPASQYFTLTLDTEHTGKAQLQLFDTTGRQVKSQQLQLEGGIFRTDIGLEGLPAGLYLVKVQNGQQVWQERLVVE